MKLVHLFICIATLQCDHFDSYELHTSQLPSNQTVLIFNNMTSVCVLSKVKSLVAELRHALPNLVFKDISTPCSVGIHYHLYPSRLKSITPNISRKH